MLSDPVPDLHMIGMSVLGETSSLRLLRGEEALLGLSDLEKSSLCLAMTSRHKHNPTTKQMVYSSLRPWQGYASQTALPASLCFPAHRQPKPAPASSMAPPANLR